MLKTTPRLTGSPLVNAVEVLITVDTPVELDRLREPDFEAERLAVLDERSPLPALSANCRRNHDYQMRYLVLLGRMVSLN